MNESVHYHNKLRGETSMEGCLNLQSSYICENINQFYVTIQKDDTYAKQKLSIIHREETLM